MRCPLLRLLAGACIACAAFADTIYTVDDLIIIGKIQRETAEQLLVVLDDGTISVPRYRIRQIEYDYDTRRQRLAADDYAGRYQLVVWALEHGRPADACAELKALAGKPGVPPEALLQLARIEHEQGDLKSAFAHLAEYLKLRPDDAEAAGLYEEVKRTLAPKPAQKPADKPAQPAEAKPAAPAANKPAEGLEAAGKWTLEGWGNKATIELVPDEHGNQVLQVFTEPGGNDKAAVGVGVHLNLKEKKQLLFNAFVDGKAPVDIAVAFITSDYYESRSITLKPGWNTNVSFDLAGKDYKSRDTNWRFETPLKNPERVRKLIFLVYNFRAQANIYLDAVHAE